MKGSDFALSAALMLSLALGGCTAGSQWMHKVQQPQRLQPTADSALLIVMRPSGFGSGVRFTLVDEKGKFLGQPLARSHYGILLPPGQYMLFVWAENVAPMQINVQAGKTYFAVARPRMGAWKARVSLTKLAPGSPDWAKLQRWLADTNQYTVDFAGGQQHLNQRMGDVRAKIDKGMQVWQQLTPQEREERLVRPGEGV